MGSYGSAALPRRAGAGLKSCDVFPVCIQSMAPLAPLIHAPVLDCFEVPQGFVAGAKGGNDLRHFGDFEKSMDGSLRPHEHNPMPLRLSFPMDSFQNTNDAEVKEIDVRQVYDDMPIWAGNLL